MGLSRWFRSCHIDNCVGMREAGVRRSVVTLCGKKVRRRVTTAPLSGASERSHSTLRGKEVVWEESCAGRNLIDKCVGMQADRLRMRAGRVGMRVVTFCGKKPQ